MTRRMAPGAAPAREGTSATVTSVDRDRRAATDRVTQEYSAGIRNMGRSADPVHPVTKGMECAVKDAQVASSSRVIQVSKNIPHK